MGMTCKVDERKWGYARKEKFTFKFSDFPSQSKPEHYRLALQTSAIRLD